jgi:hypothetical protein
MRPSAAGCATRQTARSRAGPLGRKHMTPSMGSPARGLTGCLLGRGRGELRRSGGRQTGSRGYQTPNEEDKATLRRVAEIHMAATV